MTKVKLGLELRGPHILMRIGTRVPILMGSPKFYDTAIRYYITMRMPVSRDTWCKTDKLYSILQYLILIGAALVSALVTHTVHLAAWEDL